jgi:type I restriction enzyme S subunit
MNVPDGWRQTRLKYTVETPVNGVWGGEPAGTDADVVCVRVADFDTLSGGLKEDVPTLRSVEPGQLGGRLLRRGDLLLEKSGGGELQPVGRVVIVDQDFDRHAVCSNFIGRMRPMPGYDSAYLCFLHQALYAAGRTRPSIKQTTGIQNLDADSYLAQHVVVPPADEQRRLAQQLSREVAELESARGRAQTLEQLSNERRERKLDALVHGGDDPQLRVTYVLQGIEQGWSPECDSRLADDDEWGVLKVGSVNYGRFWEEQHKALPSTLEPRPNLEVRAGDVLMSRANTRDLVGSVAYVDQTRPRLMLCDKLYRLMPDRRAVEPEYLALALSRSHVREQLEPAANGASSSMQNISQELVRSLLIPVPAAEVQRERLAAARQIVNENNAARDGAARLNEALIERRTALVARTVSGDADFLTQAGAEMEAHA